MHVISHMLRERSDILRYLSYFLPNKKSPCFVQITFKRSPIFQILGCYKDMSLIGVVSQFHKRILSKGFVEVWLVAETEHQRQILNNSSCLFSINLDDNIFRKMITIKYQSQVSTMV